MKLAARLAYYSVGFFIGIMILMFFLSGKKTSCDYGPDARVLKNIRIKNKTYEPSVLLFLKENQLDTSVVRNILNSGDVDFSNSNTKLDSCKIYAVEGEVNNKNLTLRIENCENQATIQQINFKKD
ncbi:DUF4258 domain-containing protein [Mesonia sp. K4-1]|jgi:hypothetical protein|uniref:DUF4258 domain-containing protein n=1 Tax=Mesonia sp. K4-1 TaxID=2602760 RepID=UPI0011CC86CF|nr:DUF4258 domain-containing protein [Mesonia sp. K4-1]TXK79419.1 DUF4258 domain-containing protein [Mesonia sp. K4-1]